MCGALITGKSGQQTNWNFQDAGRRHKEIVFFCYSGRRLTPVYENYLDPSNVVRIYIYILYIYLMRFFYRLVVIRRSHRILCKLFEKDKERKRVRESERGREREREGKKLKWITTIDRRRKVIQQPDTGCFIWLFSLNRSVFKTLIITINYINEDKILYTP